MRATETHLVVQGTGVSQISGVALVALGVVVLVMSVTQHIRLVHELRDGSWVAGRVSTNAVALALLLAAVGVGMGAYLVYLR